VSSGNRERRIGFGSVKMAEFARLIDLSRSGQFGGYHPLYRRMPPVQLRLTGFEEGSQCLDANPEAPCAGGRLEVPAHVAVFKRMRKCLLAARVAARERSCANMGQLAEIVAIGVFGAFFGPQRTDWEFWS
jgi:hypothetical protein